MTRQEFFHREGARFFMDQPKIIGAYCRERFPKETAHIIQVADQVCRRYFLFDLKWDMERTYEPVVFHGKIDWNYMPAGDPEFIWQFNRHRFFICLGQAYQITGEEKYARAFVELLMEWINGVPLAPENKSGPWRTLEAGLRGEYWNKAIWYFKDSPSLTDQVVDRFYHSMLEHGEYLAESHSPYKYMSNWGVLENHGLFEIAMMLPQSSRTKEFGDIALTHLAAQARLQVMRDGVHWEQSPMYHNEVLHCFLDVLLLADRNQVEVPAEIRDGAKRMLYADVAWLKPNHCQVMMGDSDDTDVRDILTVGAYVYRDPVLKFAGFPQLDFESIWDLGMGAIEEYGKIPGKEPEFTSIALPDSGNYYMRSNWKEDGSFLHFHCGTLGAGHGHSDKLHIDLAINGEDVLLDAGRYTYVPGPDRYEFKDPMAHNTITVDERPFIVCKDSWECSKLSQPVRQQFAAFEKYEFVQGGHLGYMDSGNGVFVNRKIIHIKPDIYILADEMYTGGAHTYQQYFHFNEEGVVSLAGNHALYQGKRARVRFSFLTEGIKVNLGKSRISRHYNLAVENPCIRTQLAGQGFASILTVIDGRCREREMEAEKLPVYSVLKGSSYPSSMAEAVKLSWDDREYVVIICHQEVNSPTDLVGAAGYMGFGNVIVFQKGEQSLTGEVLQW